MVEGIDIITAVALCISSFLISSMPVEISFLSVAFAIITSVDLKQIDARFFSSKDGFIGDQPTFASQGLQTCHASSPRQGKENTFIEGKRKWGEL